MNNRILFILVICLYVTATCCRGSTGPYGPRNGLMIMGANRLIGRLRVRPFNILCRSSMDRGRYRICNTRRPVRRYRGPCRRTSRRRCNRRPRVRPSITLCRSGINGGRYRDSRCNTKRPVRRYRRPCRRSSRGRCNMNVKPGRPTYGVAPEPPPPTILPRIPITTSQPKPQTTPRPQNQTTPQPLPSAETTPEVISTTVTEATTTKSTTTTKPTPPPTTKSTTTTEPTPTPTTKSTTTTEPTPTPTTKSTTTTEPTPTPTTKSTTTTEPTPSPTTRSTTTEEPEEYEGYILNDVSLLLRDLAGYDAFDDDRDQDFDAVDEGDPVLDDQMFK